MNKKQLAEHLQYPAIWQESGLLSDELFNFQAPEYQKEYGARAPTEHGALALRGFQLHP